MEAARIIESPEVTEGKTLENATGLSLAIFHEAIAAGVAAANEAGPFDSLEYKSVTLQDKAMAKFREITKEIGWVVTREKNLEYTSFSNKDHEGEISIVFVRGDEYTGVAGNRYPSTQRPRGKMTERAIIENHGLFFPQMALPQGYISLEQALHSWHRVTWFLLFCPFSEGKNPTLTSAIDRVALELSLPVEFDDRHPTKWNYRLLLPEWNANANYNPGTAHQEAPDVDAFAVSVK